MTSIFIIFFGLSLRSTLNHYKDGYRSQNSQIIVQWSNYHLQFGMEIGLTEVYIRHINNIPSGLINAF